MTFIGRLKQNSAIWHRWRAEARTGGAIHGVVFSWEPGNIYRTAPLTAEQVSLLQEHENIILESVSIDLPLPAAPTEDSAVAKVEKPVAAPAKPTYVNSRPAGRR